MKSLKNFEKVVHSCSTNSQENDLASAETCN